MQYTASCLISTRPLGLPSVYGHNMVIPVVWPNFTGNAHKNRLLTSVLRHGSSRPGLYTLGTRVLVLVSRWGVQTVIVGVVPVLRCYARWLVQVPAVGSPVRYSVTAPAPSPCPEAEEVVLESRNSYRGVPDVSKWFGYRSSVCWTCRTSQN